MAHEITGSAVIDRPTTEVLGPPAFAQRIKAAVEAS